MVEHWNNGFLCNPSVTKDKQFVAYVTQGPAAGALKNQP